MVQIIIHRGGHEIGGSAVEIRTAGGRILLDLGLPLDFDLRGTADRERLIKGGILPDIKGLYEGEEPSFDAVLLSHGHLDHCGLAHFVHPGVPVYLSRGSKTLMNLSTRFLGRKALQGQQVLFEMNSSFCIADIKITPYLMDHSAFDATAFEIFTNGRHIIYTGDFRSHGRKAAGFERFMKSITPVPDILICEGTVLGRTDALSKRETDLEHEIVKYLKHTDEVALFQCASQNIDRIVTFCRAAQRSDRTMVIDRYTAATLAELYKLGNKLPTTGKHPNLSIHRPKNVQQTLMLVRPSMKKALEADDTIKNGVFLYSLWSGYRKEHRQANFEEFLNRRGFSIVEVHTSGHADTHTIRLLIERLNPKQIIPIHTLSPKRFEEFSGRVRIVPNGEVIEC